MYRFTFIDESSVKSEPERSLSENETSDHDNLEVKSSQSLLQKTAHFLNKYLNQPNCVRIYISKN